MLKHDTFILVKYFEDINLLLICVIKQEIQVQCSINSLNCIKCFNSYSEMHNLSSFKQILEDAMNILCTRNIHS